MDVLERAAELTALSAAVTEARRGQGRVVLVVGEAGIGKTTLVKAFLSAVSGQVRTLVGGCDDLIAPLSFGPLRDAARATRGPLAAALAAGLDRDGVFGALLDELAGGTRPAVLVVEDVHWADDATLDLVRLLGRRIDELPAVLVLTYRPDQSTDGNALPRLLGAFTGPHVRRLAPAPLTPATVGRLADRVGADPAAVFAATAGNPFFVTEVLASPHTAVSATVADAVLARLAPLDEVARGRIEQLAVIAAPATRRLVETLPDGLLGLAPAERLGLVEIREDTVVFRHELARRAIEGSLPGARRIALHRLVLAHLLGHPEPDLARVLHHAVEAGNAEVIVRYGPDAARQAAFVGANRQALVILEQILRHPYLLSTAELARIHVGYAWALHNAVRTEESVTAAETAVRLFAETDDETGLGGALATLSRQRYLAGHPGPAETAARRAVALLQGHGDGYVLALARLYLDALLLLTDREREALDDLDGVLELGERLGAPDVVALGHTYRGLARARLGDQRGRVDLQRSLELARRGLDHEQVSRIYCNVVEGLHHLGDVAGEERYLREALDYGRGMDTVGPIYECRARLCARQLARGDWDAAEVGCRELLDELGRSGVIGYLVLPLLGRLLVRRGEVDEGAALLREAWPLVDRADVLAGLVPVAIGQVELAWLTGADPAAEAVQRVLARADRPGSGRWRGELLRYLQRAGATAAPFDGCPPEYATGLRGDWAGAAGEWARIGDPYQRALELAESGSTEPTLEALGVLEDLGAAPAARLVRARLRELGVTRIPRGPRPATRANPAGLTERQAEVLALLADGLTNAEIAGRLVVSVRTVDHHVAAVLTRLGVASRKEAAQRFTESAQPPMPR